MKSAVLCALIVVTLGLAACDNPSPVAETDFGQPPTATVPSNYFPPTIAPLPSPTPLILSTPNETVVAEATQEAAQANATALVEAGMLVSANATADAISNATATVRAKPSSGGLGLTREQWEKGHGPAGRRGNGGNFYGVDEGYNVLFTTPKSFSTDGERVFWLSRYYPQGPVTYKVALSESQRLIPFDAKKTEHNEHINSEGSTVIVDNYTSQSLGGLFKSYTGSDGIIMDVWDGAKPGTFHIIFAQYPDMGNKVPSFDIQPGNEK